MERLPIREVGRGFASSHNISPPPLKESGIKRVR